MTSRRRIEIVLLVALAIAGCTEHEPLRGIDLPPASTPGEIEANGWAVSFSHHFDAGFWQPGHHSYTLHLDCPRASEATVDSEPIGFTVNQVAAPLEETVYLRMVGLSLSIAGPRDLLNVSTDQETEAVVTLLGMTEDQAAAAAGCRGEIRYDDTGAAVLTPSEPVLP